MQWMAWMYVQIKRMHAHIYIHMCIYISIKYTESQQMNIVQKCHLCIIWSEVSSVQPSGGLSLLGVDPAGSSVNRVWLDDPPCFPQAHLQLSFWNTAPYTNIIFIRLIQHKVQFCTETSYFLLSLTIFHNLHFQFYLSKKVKSILLPECFNKHLTSYWSI